MKTGKVLPLFLAMLTACAGCSASGVSETDTGSAAQNISVVDTSDMFTDRDMEIGYDEQTSAFITLSGESTSCDSAAVQIADSTVTITEEGTYILSGTLDDGMVVVDAEDTDNIQLVLDGAEITNADLAAIYVREADKVVITTASGSENRLVNGGEYALIDDNNVDAAIFSKADLTLNGAGTLTVEAAAGHGVVSKDDLVLTSGTYEVTAAEGHCLSGKDSVRIAGGEYTLVSGKDGIHAENADDSSLGFLYIADGTFSITAEGDGMSAGTYMLAEDGTFTVQAGGGSANAPVQASAQEPAPGGQSQPAADDAQTEDTASTKGMKAGTDLTITGGTYTLDAADDALHSNGSLTVGGGSFTLASGDDGIHADDAVTVTAGDISISQSYEGIEGLSIDISGGEIDLTASDDGLNAAGGNDSSGFGGRGGDAFAATEGAYITISGGTLKINAVGDGVDSNGTLTITGGETCVSGPGDSGNSSLDCNGETVISGGIFLAAGSSGMAESFSTSSTQGVIMVNVTPGAAGSEISLYDSSGNELVSWQAEKEYSSVIISCPEITQGSTYTLTTGEESTEITMSSLVYSSGGRGEDVQGHGGMGGGPGNRGGMGETMPPDDGTGAPREVGT